jgi:hypothetical protein
MKKEKGTIEELESALLKKALGYLSTEITEEYSTIEGEIKLSKKKVTKKRVPPDLIAIKLLLDNKSDNIESMSDEDLEKEKARLTQLLLSAEKLPKD